MKRNKLKNSLIEQLKEMPILQFACKKVGVSRASYYRWRKDPEFAKEADAAIAEGETLITDLSEGQLISLIRDRNFPALQLWLKSHHPKYGNKVELTGNINVKEEPLTPEQEKLVEKALELAGLLENKQIQQNG
jgi:hypothetical protein